MAPSESEFDTHVLKGGIGTLLQMTFTRSKWHKAQMTKTGNSLCEQNSKGQAKSLKDKKVNKEL